jgi:hypothetical protein
MARVAEDQRTSRITTCEALKRKAASLGEIKQITEEPGR